MAEDPRFALREAGRADYPVGLPSEPDTHAGRLEWMLWKERERVAAVLALHAFDPAVPGVHSDGCRHCNRPWPCPTVVALGDDGDASRE